MSKDAIDGSSDAKDATSALRHDINNQLMGLMGYVELLLSYDDLPGRARSKVRLIAEHVDDIRKKLGELGGVTSKQGSAAPSKEA